MSTFRSKSFLASAALLFASSGAYAAACSAVDPATAGTSTTADFEYSGNDASQCTIYPGNNQGGADLSYGGLTYTELARWDFGKAANEVVADYDLGNDGSISFSINYLGLFSGWYEFELLAEGDPDSVLPGTMDLLGVTKQATEYGVWLFLEADVDIVNPGKFKVLYSSNNEFSHFGMYGRNYVSANGGGAGNGNGNGNNVPEPATLALVGLGLLGAAVARRRQRT